MLIAFLFPLLICLILSFYYLCVLSPKKKIQWYKKKIESLGYKVQTYDFMPLNSALHNQANIDTKQTGDAMYTMKKKFSKADVVIFNILNHPVIELVNPKLMKKFFTPDHPDVYPKYPTFIQNMKRCLGDGIVFSQGSEWKKRRKIISSVFNYDFMKTNISKIVRLCNQNIERMEKEYPATEEGVWKYEIIELWIGAFSNIMMECFFGNSPTYEKIDGKILSMFLSQLTTDINKQSFSPIGLLFGVNFFNLGLREEDRDINRRIKLVREMAYLKIQNRLKELQKNPPKQKYTDMIQALQYMKKFEDSSIKGHKQADKYDFSELIDEFCTFYTGGTDTSSHLITMMIYYISERPQIEDRLRRDINLIIKSDQDITEENLKKLNYIDLIQNETLRYYGPGNGVFDRMAMKDHLVEDIPISKGTLIGVQPMGNHYKEEYFKDPYEFRPERWQNECDNLPPLAYMPFSSGQRSCIGKNLVLLETKIALVIFMRKYKSFQLPKKDYYMSFTFIYQPEPMKMILKSEV